MTIPKPGHKYEQIRDGILSGRRFSALAKVFRDLNKEGGLKISPPLPKT